MISMGTVWDRTTEFLSDNIAAVLPIALLAIFLPSAISQSLAPLSKGAGSGAVLIQIVSLGLSIVSLWGQLSISALALDPIAGRSAATAHAARRLPAVIGLSIIILVGVMLLLLPFVVVLVSAGYDFQTAMNGGNAEVPAGVGGFLGIYSLLFLCIMLWLGSRLALISPIVLMEGRWLGAFARSFKLTRRIMWKMIGVIILYAIIWFVSFLAAKLVFGAVFAMIAGGEGPVTTGSVLASILVSFVLVLFSVFASAFIAKLYLAVRDAREAIVDSL
ncbi:MAG: hypothetical protein V4472_20390 [Pseudomonadota bacterium]